MRAKLLDKGPSALGELELLEMLLYAGNRRGDTKPLAKALIRRFGSLSAVIRAPAALAPRPIALIAALVSVTAKEARCRCELPSCELPSCLQCDGLVTEQLREACVCGDACRCASDACGELCQFCGGCIRACGDCQCDLGGCSCDCFLSGISGYFQ